MRIPKKALKHSQLTYLTAGSAVADGSHQTFKVTFEEGGVVKKAFLKKLEPKNHYPELLAKISVATSSFKRLFQGKRSAEERLVFDDQNNIIGSLSICIDDFKPFHYIYEGIPTDNTLKEQVVPSVSTLIQNNIMELLLGRWVLGDDDSHPHNMSLVGDIDFDMFFYRFTVYMKVARLGIGVPKTHVNLTVKDWEALPNLVDDPRYHWPPYKYPGKASLPVLVPGVQERVLPNILPKAFADSSQFFRLAGDSVAKEQQFAAALKFFLTYNPELQRRRLTELFGNLPLNYSSLDETDVNLRSQYEQLYPQFCNTETNTQPFVDFMMKLYQEHYDNLYRVVVFYMGCANNGFGVSLPATCFALYQKPSFYRKIEQWVKKENETTYAEEPHLQYDLHELQKRYHQVWRDAFGPMLKELLHSSYRLMNTLLKETTAPPHPKILEIVSKQPTDNGLTKAWELFGNLPELSLDVIESKISVHKDSKLRDALLSMAAFTNQFHRLIKTYYDKENSQITEADNLEFAKHLNLLYQTYDIRIRQALANTTPCALEFNSISSSLELISKQVNFSRHLTTTDEQMWDAFTAVKKDLLPFTHEDVKKQYYDSLFSWAKSLKPEDLERLITEIIDKKYAPYLPISLRHRATPVKKYLASSRQESGDNRLAYILSSGTESGALNTLLITWLTPHMLQKQFIPSIDMAIRDKSFEAGISEFTVDVVSFAKKDKNFTHAYSEEGMALIFKAMYDWTDSLTENSFAGLIKSTLTKYERGKWGGSRREEVLSYLQSNNNARALAMIFMNGLDSSTFNELLFVTLMDLIKIDYGKYPKMQSQLKYKLIDQLNIDEHKYFYLSNLKHHSETIAASSSQLQLTHVP